MAKYRCPRCGATHSDPEDFCRMCGSSMDPAAASLAQVGNTDTAISAERFKRKGLGHFVLIGLAVLAVIILGAMVTGVADGSGVVQWARANVPGLEADPDDGWETYADSDDLFIVELPDEPDQTNGPVNPDVTAPDLSALDGTVTRWDFTLDQETVTLVHVADPAIDVDPDEPTPSTESFRDALGDAFGTNASLDSDAVVTEIGDGEGWVQDVRFSSVPVEGLSGQASIRWWLFDDDLFMVMTRSPRDSSLHNRVRNSFHVQNETTIVPDDVVVIGSSDQ